MKFYASYGKDTIMFLNHTPHCNSLSLYFLEAKMHL